MRNCVNETLVLGFDRLNNAVERLEHGFTDRPVVTHGSGGSTVEYFSRNNPMVEIIGQLIIKNSNVFFRTIFSLLN